MAGLFENPWVDEVRARPISWEHALEWARLKCFQRGLLGQLSAQRETQGEVAIIFGQ